ncbi:MAG TPA: hypothetical protein VFA65_13080 [Bryobacteraceae bacterium]|nr:hypothetical protein [Bryobacteraceae bacterium]
MSRNVDLIAVGLLLLGIVVYSHVRNLVVLAVNDHNIGFTRYSRTIIVPPRPPTPPRLPHIKVMRD